MALEDYYTTLTRQVVTNVPDGYGGTTESVTTATIHGKIQALSGGEVYRNSQIGLKADCRMFTNDAVTVADRIIDADNITYEVAFVNNIEGHHYEVSLKRLV